MFPSTIAVVSGSVTRPADTTAYASGDLVANSTDDEEVVPITLDGASLGPSRTAQVRRVSISKSGVSVTTASFRVHLFTTGDLTVANGDNGVLSIDGAANYLGSVDVTVGQAFTDGAHGSAATEINARAETLYAVIEARSAYTPVSAEVFTVTLEIAQQ